MTRAITAALLVALAVCVPAAAQPPYTSPFGPGFKTTVGGELVECNVRRGKLECLDYGGALPEGAECDFGGTIASVALRASGPARTGFVCVDEGFHGWKALRVGKTFRSGPFRCTLHVERLACRNRGDAFDIAR